MGDISSPIELSPNLQIMVSGYYMIVIKWEKEYGELGSQQNADFED